MPVGLTAPRQESLIDMIIKMEGMKTQKESLKLRKEYQDIYGKQVDTAAKESEYLMESTRKLNVARARGLTVEAKKIKTGLDLLKGMPVDAKRALFYADEINKNLRSQTFAMTEQLNLAKLQLQQEAGLRAQDANMRAMQDAIRKKSEDEVDAILSPHSGLPAEDALEFAAELKRIRGVYGPVDQEAIQNLYGDIRNVRGKERDRALKAEITGEKRGQDFEMKKMRESWSDWPPEEGKRAEYEYGSYEELDLANENSMPRPEVRWIYYDPKGFGWGRTRKDKTGVEVPSGYQRGARKKMTERRALALGLHDDWIAAGSSTEAADPLGIRK